MTQLKKLEADISFKDKKLVDQTKMKSLKISQMKKIQICIKTVNTMAIFEWCMRTFFQLV